MDKLIAYIKASIAEMKKVTWPTKKETYNYTILVVGISVGTALLLFGFDKLFENILRIVINK